MCSIKPEEVVLAFDESEMKKLRSAGEVGCKAGKKYAKRVKKLLNLLSERMLC